MSLKIWNENTRWLSEAAWCHLSSFDRIRTYWSEYWTLFCWSFTPFVCSYLQMADWLYAGPSAALSAWPTWVCVRPRDSRRILNALANSRISSRLTPSTSLGAVCGSTIQHTHTHLSLLALCRPVAYLIFQSEWSKHPDICDHHRLWTTFKKIVVLQVRTYYFSLPRAVNCICLKDVLKNKFIWHVNAGMSWLWLASVNL